jgi:hypothetical protein
VHVYELDIIFCLRARAREKNGIINHYRAIIIIIIIVIIIRSRSFGTQRGGPSPEF